MFELPETKPRSVAVAFAERAMSVTVCPLASLGSVMVLSLRPKRKVVASMRIELALRVPPKESPSNYLMTLPLAMKVLLSVATFFQP